MPVGLSSKTRLFSGYITPLLDYRLLDLPWVNAGPGADLLGDVNTLLSGLEQRHQLGDMFALLLWLQVAGLFRDLRDDSLSLGKTLLWARLQLTARWATELLRHLLTLSLGRVLLDILLLGLANLFGPLGTLLLGGVAISDILTFLLLNCLTLNNIIFNIMLMVPSFTLGLIDSFALYRTLSITDKRSVAELCLLLRSNLFVVNEAVLDEVLLTFLLLLGLEVSCVGGVTLLAVAMFALDDIIVLSLFNHDNLVNATLASCGNGSNVQGDVITATLTGSTGVDGVVSVGMSMLVLMVVIVSSVASSITVSLVEWECSPQVLAPSVWPSGGGAASQQKGETKAAKSVHIFVTGFEPASGGDTSTAQIKL